jgi:hypothetical protein
MSETEGGTEGVTEDDGVMMSASGPVAKQGIGRGLARAQHAGDTVLPSGGRADRAREVISRPLEVTTWTGRDRGGGGGSPKKSRWHGDMRLWVQGLSRPYFHAHVSAGAQRVYGAGAVPIQASPVAFTGHGGSAERGAWR